MIFSSSAEIFQPAYSSFHIASSCVDSFLKAAFAVSSLSTLDCKLRYIPIVMPPDMAKRYPTRSKLRMKERLYDCSPQLDYEVFVTGSFEEQLQEYIDGIMESVPHLIRLGATHVQIDDFNKIMSTAVGRILIERPDQTRH